MLSGDEFYDDDITSGPIEDEDFLIEDEDFLIEDGGDEIHWPLRYSSIED